MTMFAKHSNRNSADVSNSDFILYKPHLLIFNLAVFGSQCLLIITYIPL